jgi:hypothetical protein
LCYDWDRRVIGVGDAGGSSGGGRGAFVRSPSALDAVSTPLAQALEAKLEDCASADAASALLDEHAIDIDAATPFGLESVDLALSRGFNHLIATIQKSGMPMSPSEYTS